MAGTFWAGPLSNIRCVFLGSFGRVLLAKNKKNGEFFAMKRLKKADIIKLRQVDHVISENTILADIDHPFLVSACNCDSAGGPQRICARRTVSLLPHAVHSWRRALHVLAHGRQAFDGPRHVSSSLANSIGSTQLK